MGFMDLFKKKSDSVQTANGSALFSKDDLMTIGNCYMDLKSKVSMKALNGMDDAMKALDEMVPSIISGKTTSLTYDEWKKVIKNFIKFYIIYGALIEIGPRMGRSQREIDEARKTQERVVKAVMLLIHKCNEANPLNPIFYSLISVEAYNEKFQNMRVPMSIMGGNSIDVSYLSDKDHILQGLAAEYYIVETYIKEKLNNGNQGDYGDATWSSLKEAIPNYDSIRDKLLRLDYKSMTDEDWENMVTIWAIKGSEFEKGEIEPDPQDEDYRNALSRASGYQWHIEQAVPSTKITDRVKEKRQFIKQDVGIESKMHELAKLVVKEGADCYVAYWCDNGKGTNLNKSYLDFIYTVFAGTQLFLEKHFEEGSSDILFEQIAELLSKNYGMDMIYNYSSPMNRHEFSVIEAPDDVQWREGKDSIKTIYDSLKVIEKEVDVDEDADDLERIIQAISDYIIKDYYGGEKPRYYFGQFANIHNFRIDAKNLLGV